MKASTTSSNASHFLVENNFEEKACQIIRQGFTKLKWSVLSAIRTITVQHKPDSTEDDQEILNPITGQHCGHIEDLSKYAKASTVQY